MSTQRVPYQMEIFYGNTFIFLDFDDGITNDASCTGLCLVSNGDFIKYNLPTGLVFFAETT